MFDEKRDAHEEEEEDGGRRGEKSPSVTGPSLLRWFVPSSSVHPSPRRISHTFAKFLPQ